MQNSPRVARYLARFLRFLIKNSVEISKIHLIGFSLGAEVAGFAGKILKEWKMELPRITGEYKFDPFTMLDSKFIVTMMLFITIERIIYTFKINL